MKYGQERKKVSVKREVRVFVSSTFHDMRDERSELMRLTWPVLREFCQSIGVEFVEVDLQWGILAAEEKCKRGTALEICLDEIDSCRPFFIGILGERYGSSPKAIGRSLIKGRPWLNCESDKSYTEIEMIHGVMAHPACMSGNSFFYFRDTDYARDRGGKFLPKDTEEQVKQEKLKNRLREVCRSHAIPLADYSQPTKLAERIRDDLKAVIEESFSSADKRSGVQRKREEHMEFACSRRGTYVKSRKKFHNLDRFVRSAAGGYFLHGGPGIGKSSLIANWVESRGRGWFRPHRELLIVHHLECSVDSSDSFDCRVRIIAEIKEWTSDQGSIPKTRAEIHTDFPFWLEKARLYAQAKRMKCIVVLDGIERLEDDATNLSWFPESALGKHLKLIVTSTKDSQIPSVRIESANWMSGRIDPLNYSERKSILKAYLLRYGKELTRSQIECICSSDPCVNPQFLKILIDELRVTGLCKGFRLRIQSCNSAEELPEPESETVLYATVGGRLHLKIQPGADPTRVFLYSELDAKPGSMDVRGGVKEALLELRNELRDITRWKSLSLSEERNIMEGIAYIVGYSLRCELDHRIEDYTSASDIRGLLGKVLSRVIRDYEDEDNEGFVGQLLGLIWASRRGLAESELLTIARPAGKERLPYFHWAPIRAALKESLINRNGVYSFANSFLRAAVEENVMVTANSPDNIRSELIEFFEKEIPVCERSCDELPWLLKKTGQLERLRDCLLNFERFLEIERRDSYELLRYWLDLGLEASVASAYIDSFSKWSREVADSGEQRVRAAGPLAHFLELCGFNQEAETLLESILQNDDRESASARAIIPILCDLGITRMNLGKFSEAALAFSEAESLVASQVPDYEGFGTILHNLGAVYLEAGDYEVSERYLKRAQSCLSKKFGDQHQVTSDYLNTLARLLQESGDIPAAEEALQKAVKIEERVNGVGHPSYAVTLGNLAEIRKMQGFLGEAENLAIKSLEVMRSTLGNDHPNTAMGTYNLARIYEDRGESEKAELLLHKTLSVLEEKVGSVHPDIAMICESLSAILVRDRHRKAAEFGERALNISLAVYGNEHPFTAERRFAIGKVLHQASELASSEEKVDLAARAEESLREAIRVDEKLRGPEHPILIRRYVELSKVLSMGGNLELGMEILRRAQWICENCFGEEHMEALGILVQTGEMQFRFENYELAEEIFRLALGRYRFRKKGKSPLLFQILAGLIRCLDNTGRPEEGEIYLEELKVLSNLEN
jgi:tetratricopeptide (TPR) repeat protein